MNLLLEALIKSTALLLITGAIAALAARSPAGVRSRIWLVGLLALALVPLSLLIRPLFSVSIASLLPRSSNRAASLPVLPAPILPGGYVTTYGGRQTETLRPMSAMAEARDRSRGSLPWQKALAVLYGLGAMIAIVRLGRGHGELFRLVHASRPVEFPEVAEAVGSLCPVTVLMSDAVPVPMAYGWRRALILLPTAALHWSPDCRRSILQHEAAHIRRHDWACFFSADLVCALWWFHPLVWLAAARLRAETEFACDALVLSHGIAPTRYAESLLEVVTMLKHPVCAPTMVRTRRIEDRIRAILTFVPVRRSRFAPVLLSIGSLCALSVLLVRVSAGAQEHAPVVPPALNLPDASRPVPAALPDQTLFAPGVAQRPSAPYNDMTRTEVVPLRWLNASDVPKLVRDIPQLEQVNVDLRNNTVTLVGTGAAIAAAKQKIAYTDTQTPLYCLTARVIAYRVPQKGRVTESILFRPTMMTLNLKTASMRIGWTDPKDHPAPDSSSKVHGFSLALTPALNPDGTLTLTAEIQEQGAQNVVIHSGRNIVHLTLNRTARVVGMTDEGLADATDRSLRRRVEQGEIVQDHGAYHGMYVEVKAELVNPNR